MFYISDGCILLEEDGGIGTAQGILQPPNDQNQEVQDCKDQEQYQDVQYEVPEIVVSPFPMTTTSTPKRKASLLLSPMESIDFDTLFEDPSKITCGIRDGGIGTAQGILQPPNDQNQEVQDCKDQEQYQDVQYEVPEIVVSPFPMTTTSTPKRKASLLLSPMESIDFDTLFEDPSKITCGIRESFDEGVFSFDDESEFLETEGDRSSRQTQLNKQSNIFRFDSRVMMEQLPEEDMTTKARLSRVDRIMGRSLAQILVESWENSRNLLGFRYKVANKINHKYCSYYRCDDMIFVFLYIVFGIGYICAGAIGIGQCSSEKFVNLYLMIDGIFSVFVFPITIMEWTKRIGGCTKLDENSGHGVTFATILILRIAAAITGTVVLVLRDNLFPRDDLICWAVFSLLEVGVALEWIFMIFAILIPLLLYIGAYIVARKL